MTSTLAAAAALPETHAPLYLDDMAVGDRYTSGEHAMDETQIKAFAAQFDPQPFHLDDSAGRATLFGGLAASGWHTAAITMRLQVTTGLPIAGGIIGAGAEISWPRPTRASDVLHVVSEVMEIQPSRTKPDRGMVTVRSETRNQQGDVLQLSTVRIVVPRRPGAATALTAPTAAAGAAS
jgi:acyl dehydratase